MNRVVTGMVFGYIIGVLATHFSNVKNEQRLRERGARLLMTDQRGIKREQAEVLMEMLIPTRG